MSTVTCQHERTTLETIDHIDGIHTYPAYVCYDCGTVVEEYDGEDY